MKQRLTHNRILINNYQDERKNLIEKKTLLMHDYDELLVVLESVNRSWTPYQLARNIHLTEETKIKRLWKSRIMQQKKLKKVGGYL